MPLPTSRPQQCCSRLIGKGLTNKTDNPGTKKVDGPRPDTWPVPCSRTYAGDIMRNSEDREVYRLNLGGKSLWRAYSKLGAPRKRPNADLQSDGNCIGKGLRSRGGPHLQAEEAPSSPRAKEVASCQESSRLCNSGQQLLTVLHAWLFSTVGRATHRTFPFLHVVRTLNSCPELHVHPID
jgi:hypothetical protein